MNNNMKTNNQAGFIKGIILIIIAIALLSYFGINLKEIWEFILKVWHKLLETPFKMVWDFIIIKIWTPFLESINSLNS